MLPDGEAVRSRFSLREGHDVQAHRRRPVHLRPPRRGRRRHLRVVGLDACLARRSRRRHGRAARLPGPDGQQGLGPGQRVPRPRPQVHDRLHPDAGPRRCGSRSTTGSPGATGKLVVVVSKPPHRRPRRAADLPRPRAGSAGGGRGAARPRAAGRDGQRPGLIRQGRDHHAGAPAGRPLPDLRLRGRRPRQGRPVRRTVRLARLGAGTRRPRSTGGSRTRTTATCTSTGWPSTGGPPARAAPATPTSPTTPRPGPAGSCCRCGTRSTPGTTPGPCPSASSASARSRSRPRPATTSPARGTPGRSTATGSRSRTSAAKGARSTMKLRKGEKVQIIVRGTQRSHGVEADAACVRTSTGWAPRDPGLALSQDPLDLWVDGHRVNWRSIGKTDVCSEEEHSYTTRFTAAEERQAPARRARPRPHRQRGRAEGDPAPPALTGRVAQQADCRPGARPHACTPSRYLGSAC